MLIKSALATQMSGSVGGMTASHNKGGMYLRARAIPVNPNSVAQQAARTAFTELTTAWIEELTAAQRDGWRVYATNVLATNPLGDSVQNSGQNWYISLNSPRLRAGLSRVDNAPGIFDQATLNPVSIAMTNADTPAILVAFDDGQDWLNEDGSALIVQSSRPQNATIEFFKGPFRLAGVVEGDSVTPPTTPASVLGAFAYTTDQKIFARVRLSRADGRLSSPQIVTTTITAA